MLSVEQFLTIRKIILKDYERRAFLIEEIYSASKGLFNKKAFERMENTRTLFKQVLSGISVAIKNIRIIGGEDVFVEKVVKTMETERTILSRVYSSFICAKKTNREITKDQSAIIPLLSELRQLSFILREHIEKEKLIVKQIENELLKISQQKRKSLATTY